MTTYDSIWETFVDNCGVDQTTLPSTDEGKYILIHNGIKKYNTTVDSSETKLTYDDTAETINIDLDDNRLLILAYCMRYTFLENELMQFQQIYMCFQKDVGMKFYSDQIKGREATLQRTKHDIEQLLLNIDRYSFLD